LKVFEDLPPSATPITIAPIMTTMIHDTASLYFTARAGSLLKNESTLPPAAETCLPAPPAELLLLSEYVVFASAFLLFRNVERTFAHNVLKNDAIARKIRFARIAASDNSFFILPPSHLSF